MSKIIVLLVDMHELGKIAIFRERMQVQIENTEFEIMTRQFLMSKRVERDNSIWTKGITRDF